MNPSEDERIDAFCQELAIALRRLSGKGTFDPLASPELPKLVTPFYSKPSKIQKGIKDE